MSSVEIIEQRTVGNINVRLAKNINNGWYSILLYINGSYNKEILLRLHTDQTSKDRSMQDFFLVVEVFRCA